MSTSIHAHSNRPGAASHDHPVLPTPRVEHLGDQNLARRHGKAQILATRVGLELPNNLTFEAWEQAGPKLFRISDSAAWCLGDWLIYGQEKYEDRYKRTLETAGLDYQTLRNYAWVARKFDLARRHERLSFQHHAEVASLSAPVQDDWLDRAEALGWSRNRLRRELREGRLGRHTPDPTPLVPRLRVAEDAVTRWRAAANKSDTDLEQWIIHVLDLAARQELGGDSDPAIEE